MLKLAWRNLMSRKMRSILSLLGMTVAIAGMVGLFSVSEGLDRLVNRSLGRVSGLIAMQPGAPIPLFSSLPAAWGEEIAQVPGVSVVAPEVWQRVNVINKKMIVSPPRFFFGADLTSRQELKSGIYREDMIKGRFLDERDRNSNHAVISKSIADQFQADLGDKLEVNGHEIEIVGMYDSGSILFDVAILLDIRTVRRFTRFDENSVSCFYIEPEEEVDPEALSIKIQEMFRGREPDPWRNSSAQSQQVLGNLVKSIVPFLPKREGNAPPEEENSPGTPAPETSSRNSLGNAPIKEGEIDTRLPIEVRSTNEMVNRIDKMSEDLDLFLLLITAIGVTVAVLSIINTMLMSVTERIIEFGILKANGWARKDVLRLITFESALLGFGGGVFGCLLGWLSTHIINAAFPDKMDLYASPQLLVFSLAFSTTLGVLGGLYPAIWAMRLMPMDAIRRG